jgi:hypothetical protein
VAASARETSGSRPVNLTVSRPDSILRRLPTVRTIVRAVIWTFAAHPASFPASLAVSADFPGLIWTALRHRFGAECAVVYLPGLAGSVVPKVPWRWPRTPSEAAMRLLPFYYTGRSFL